ncbi:MAG: gephyrin-like molybdotransferase Glp [Nocardioides sp.]|uniref:molybdotransferase-like divisome protein Glp n=1 Tax=Nocardioides sp. TaxID=35761 RepID=UPI003EFBD251
MPEAQNPVPVEELLERVLGTVQTLPDFPLPLMDTLGLALAEDVHAEVALPSFDNSAMDGYAVRAADVEGATAADPVELPVVGEIGAGQASILALSPGTAVKIMTGAPVPAGADAVVPYEATDRGVARVRISEATAPGRHVRRVGDDVERGEKLLEAGTVVGPRQLGLLAAVGRATVRTRPRPRVVVISTGSELRDPGTPLGEGAIYDGNSFLLAAAAREAGALAYRVGIVPDDPHSFREALADQLVRADIVVTSGGVSQGDFDVVKEALRGDEGMWFGPVAMQPGKPQGFGTVGEDRVPIFTLPGNPVSAYVSFQVFVLPAIRKMMGVGPAVRPTRTVTLTEAVKATAGRRQYVRARHADGRATPVGGHGSHLLGDLSQSNALVVVPEDVTALPAGSRVQALLLDEEF